MGFFRWLGSIFAAALNSIARLVALLVLVAVVLVIIGLVRGDGVPGNTVLTLDMRDTLADSSSRPALPLMGKPLTVMDLVFALDSAGRDARVKGVLMSWLMPASISVRWLTWRSMRSRMVRKAWAARRTSVAP